MLLFKDMGAVIGEAEPLNAAEDAVKLNIQIEDNSAIHSRGHS